MLKAKLLGATAGAEAALAIEDVFSTYLYTGNGSTQTINNGIDLAGEGGLVWIKSRSAATDNFLFDTVRGTTKEINSNSTAVEATLANSLTAFNANGFSIGSATGIGVNAATYASWTFRKAPRFFDVVTWVGNGSSTQTIPHGLGAAPGCIIIKDTNFALNWRVYHTSRGTSKHLVLNSTAAEANSSIVTATSGADFTVNSNGTSSGRTHVAYLFAHDPLGPSGDGSDGLIACGGASAASISSPAVVNLGWEPQWILWKNSSVTDNWHIFDTMRGIGSFNTGQVLRANTSDAEATLGDATYPININSTGFSFNPGYFGWGGASNVFTYIAIRRGPMREPTVGTEVFHAIKGSLTTGTKVTTGFPVDWQWPGTKGTKYNWSRLTGVNTTDTEVNHGYLVFNTTQAESSLSLSRGWSNTDYKISANLSSSDALYYSFRRAPGFFDVVAYTGNSSTNTLNHNLGVAPEMIVYKARNGAVSWRVHANITSGGYDRLVLDSTAAKIDTEAYGSTKELASQPTATQLVLGGGSGTNNSSSYNYIAYLFASLPGISKVGSYTGNGSNQTINCGFTTGARFILIKRTDSTGDWYVWDTARGIVTGNDPHLSLNTTAAEVTTNDTIDPDNSGFIVNQVAATNVNVNAATYIFLAIA